MSKSIFNYIALADDRALVTDGNKRNVVLDVADWNRILETERLLDAQCQFDTEVEDFYSALTEAADRLAEAATKAADPNTFYVVNEGVEGEAHQCAEIIELGYGSQIARLINNGQTDRLMWVGNDRIEILAYEG